MVVVPSIYTIQAQYLARYPVYLSNWQAFFLTLFGLAGYAIFRSANHQKDIVRSTNGRVKVWGSKPEYIRCAYKTEDGKTHEALLLCSGKIFSFSQKCFPRKMKLIIFQSLHRLVGILTPCQLSRRFDASINDIHRMWIHPPVTMDILPVSLRRSVDSHLSRRAKMPKEVRKQLEALL